jgi:hypothetical protein
MTLTNVIECVHDEEKENREIMNGCIIVCLL